MKHEALYSQVDKIVRDCLEKNRRPTIEELNSLAGYAEKQSQADREKPFWLMIRNATGGGGVLRDQGAEVLLKVALLSVAAGLTTPEEAAGG